MEAKRVRDAAERLIAGAVGWTTVVSEWNRSGVITAQGSKWTVNGLKAVLVNPRICGYRSQHMMEFNPESQTEKRRVVPVYDDEGKPVKGFRTRFSPWSSGRHLPA
jgi:site-specific DNA recombinase